MGAPKRRSLTTRGWLDTPLRLSGGSRIPLRNVSSRAAPDRPELRPESGISQVHQGVCRRLDGIICSMRTRRFDGLTANG